MKTMSEINNSKWLTYHIRVNAAHGGFAFYDVKAANSIDAQKIAKENFYRDFCSGHETIKLNTFCINNPDNFKNIEPFLNEIEANK